MLRRDLKLVANSKVAGMQYLRGVLPEDADSRPRLDFQPEKPCPRRDGGKRLLREEGFTGAAVTSEERRHPAGDDVLDNEPCWLGLAFEPLCNRGVAQLRARLVEGARL